MEIFATNMQNQLSTEFKGWLGAEVKVFKTEFLSQVRKDSNAFLLQGLHSTEKNIMILEGQCEDLKISQGQCLEELMRFQEGVDRQVYRNKEDLDRKLERLA